jgi:hypothetical protein
VRYVIVAYKFVSFFDFKLFQNVVIVVVYKSVLLFDVKLFFQNKTKHSSLDRHVPMHLMEMLVQCELEEKFVISNDNKQRAIYQ